MGPHVTSFFVSRKKEKDRGQALRKEHRCRREVAPLEPDQGEERKGKKRSYIPSTFSVEEKREKRGVARRREKKGDRCGHRLSGRRKKKDRKKFLIKKRRGRNTDPNLPTTEVRSPEGEKRGGKRRRVSGYDRIGGRREKSLTKKTPGGSSCLRSEKKREIGKGDSLARKKRGEGEGGAGRSVRGRLFYIGAKKNGERCRWYPTL